MENATLELERETPSRLELLKICNEGQCTSLCNKTWLTCALELLQKNIIHPFVYASAMRDALIKGRGKFRNIMIIGPANCGKTFMLKPLEKIYKTFLSPANDKYGWVGADKAELILLQDYRWNRESIQWKDLLLLLEGETVKLPAPKNLFNSDVVISKDIPIFATSKSKIVHCGKFNYSDERETEMMSARWKYIEFSYQIPQSMQKEISPCERCFAELALMGETFNTE